MKRVTGKIPLAVALSAFCVVNTMGGVAYAATGKLKLDMKNVDIKSRDQILAEQTVSSGTVNARNAAANLAIQAPTAFFADISIRDLKIDSKSKITAKQTIMGGRGNFANAAANVALQ